MLTVAIVGKPNVGKSTIFNRIVQKTHAIVDDQPGVTRDRIYDQASWLGCHFDIIDTGGLTTKKLDFQKNIQLQVSYALEEADVILFVVSKKEGINQDDYFVAKTLKKYQKQKPILLVVNKVDHDPSDQQSQIYHSLGFSSPINVSASHGIGFGDLLDAIIKYDKKQQHQITSTTKIAIIGKPNVGKSSLVNTILQEDRVIVSDIAGTTRDSIDCDFKYHQKNYTIIDTAGIRRKGKVTDSIEKYALLRVQKAIARANIILLILDGSQPFKEQDETIAGLAFAANIPTIIAINKWDLVNKSATTMAEYTKKIKSQFQFLTWAPIIFISAKQNARIAEIFKAIDNIQNQLQLKVKTSVLNDVLNKALILNPPAKVKNGRLTISHATQVNGSIPTFVIFVNNPKYLHFSYARYLENQVRAAFGIDSVPITLYFKDKNARNR